MERLIVWPLHPGAMDILDTLTARRAAAVRAIGGKDGGIRLRGAIRRLGPGRPDDAPDDSPEEPRVQAP